MSEIDVMDGPDAQQALAQATDAERRGVDKAIQRLGRMGREVSAYGGPAAPDRVAEAFLDELRNLGHE